MRLIDADDVMEMLSNIESSYSVIPITEAKLALRDIPTAHDVDKVVEQFEKDILELKEQLIYMSNEDMAVRLRCKMHGLDRGIEIVKAGGVNG